MIKRCIMVFPSFDNLDIINEIRGKYDPLCNVIRPHITLVFPFDSEITTDELEAHIKAVLSNHKPFALTMQGFTASVEPWANYLFLNVTQGLPELYELSGSLYTGILEKHQSDLYRKSYCPHMTVGRLDKGEDYEAALSALGNEETVFKACIDCVSVEIIGDDESYAIIEMTIAL